MTRLNIKDRLGKAGSIFRAMYQLWKRKIMEEQKSKDIQLQCESRLILCIRVLESSTKSQRQNTSIHQQMSTKNCEFTLCPEKGSHLMFDNNFGKCGPTFKIISPTDSWENSLCTWWGIITGPPSFKGTLRRRLTCIFFSFNNKKPSYCWDSQPSVAIFRT